jgi:hypothetical protein
MPEPETEMTEQQAEAWVSNEPGPDCSCGNATVVKQTPDGGFVLLCLFHTADAGLITALPDHRPDNWYQNLPQEDDDDG